MKILEINTEKGWRGGERQTFYCLKGFKNEQKHVELLCRKNTPLAEAAKNLNIPVHTVSDHFSALLFLLRFGKSYDILHPQTAKGHSLSVLSKPAHKRPILYTRRVDFAPKGLFSKFKYSRTDKVIAISTAIQKILHHAGISNVDVIPSITIPENVSEERITSLRDKFPPDKKIIGTVAALVPHKDPHTMANAIQNLKKIRGEDFVFLHFGDGSLFEEIEKTLKEKEIQSCYRLMGFHQELVPYYSILDVFVMSSQEEGLGSSVLDAFLYGVPVVSTSAGGLEHLVSKRGKVCPVKDHECLALSVNAILDNPDEAEQLCKKARKYVLAEHGLDRMTQKYLQYFRDLVQR